MNNAGFYPAHLEPKKIRNLDYWVITRVLLAATTVFTVTFFAYLFG